MSTITNSCEIDTQFVNREIVSHEDAQGFSYNAYGLGIHSAIPILAFTPAVVECDVTITIDKNSSLLDYVPQEVLEQSFALHVELEEAVVYVKDTGVFLIRKGCEVVVIPAANIDHSKLQMALVGTVMAILLQQRGALVLHGSAVEIRGKAVLFLGNSGEGKSSMAAALQAQGYTLVADDIAAVSWESGKAVLAPGFPQIKLSREMAEGLGYDWASLGQLHPRLEKRGLRLAQEFPQKPLPIHRIYLLTTGSEVRCEPMKMQGGLMTLLQHSELMKLFDSQEVMNFQKCTRLAQSCEVVCLQRPRDLSLLPKLVELVEKDVGASVLPTP